jgi:hypothetical protein
MNEGLIGLGYIYGNVGRTSEAFHNSSLNTTDSKYTEGSYW